MTQNTDLCPIIDNGNHRYFIYKVVEVYEPFTANAIALEDGKAGEAIMMELVSSPLYSKVEYAISGCNCGSTIKQRVKQQ